MGADLIIAVVGIEAGKKPDWDAAREHLNEADPERIWAADSVRARFERDEDQEARELMLASLADVADIWNGDRWVRSASKLTIRGSDVLVVGGTSWGESPSDTFDQLSDLVDTGALQAAGFETPELPTSFRIEL